MAREKFYSEHVSDAIKTVIEFVPISGTTTLEQEECDDLVQKLSVLAEIAQRITTETATRKRKNK